MSIKHKVFAAYSVLKAEDVNNYLMDQTVVSVDLESDLSSLPSTVKVAYVTGNGRTYTRSSTSAWRYTSGGATPFMKVRRTTAVTTTANTWWPVPWQSTLDSTDATMWNVASPTRLVAPVQGIYTVSASVGFPASVNVFLGIAKGGSVYRKASGNSGNGPELFASETLKFNAGEYAEICAYSISAVALTAYSEIQPSATMVWVGNF